MRKIIILMLFFIGLLGMQLSAQSPFQAIRDDNLKSIKAYFEVLDGDPSVIEMNGPRWDLVETSIAHASGYDGNTNENTSDTMNILDYLLTKMNQNNTRYLALALDAVLYLNWEKSLETYRTMLNYIQDLPKLMLNSNRYDKKMNPLEYIIIEMKGGSFNTAYVIEDLVVRFPSLKIRGPNELPYNDFSYQGALAVAAAKNDIGGIKKLLKTNTPNASLAIATAMLAGNLDVIKFFKDDLGVDDSSGVQIYALGVGYEESHAGKLLSADMFNYMKDDILKVSFK